MNEKQVFISYAREDASYAKKLYDDLVACGLTPWLDTVSLLLGLDWKTEVRKAIRESRFFIALLSSHSVTKTGYVQKELVEALEMLDEFPSGTIFLVPARLDNSIPSHEKLKGLQWVDMFPSWSQGFDTIKRALGVSASVTPAPGPGERDMLMQILNAGTKAYFREIVEAQTDEKRQEAIDALHNTLRESLLRTIGMPEDVYRIFIEDCIRRQELLDWDQWLTQRIANMTDLPQNDQQTLFNFGLSQLISRMKKDNEVATK